MTELGHLPIAGTLPACASKDSVEAFLGDDSRDGPTLDNPLYYWHGDLNKCRWNRTLTHLLAEAYIQELASNRIKYNGSCVEYDPGAVNHKMICQLICKRIRRTRQRWLEVWKSNSFVNNSYTPQMQSNARREQRILRRRNRGKKASNRRRLAFVP
jgi:hypothetical protein